MFVRIKVAGPATVSVPLPRSVPMVVLKSAVMVLVVAPGGQRAAGERVTAARERDVVQRDIAGDGDGGAAGGGVGREVGLPVLEFVQATSGCRQPSWCSNR